MDLSSLSAEDKLSIFELCKASGTQADDPMALLFMEWMKAKREMLDIARGKKEGIEHAAQELRSNALALTSTLEMQKEVAEVLQRQIVWISWVKYRMIMGSFAIGAALAFGALTAFHQASPSLENKLKELSAGITVTEGSRGPLITLSSTRIAKAERTPNGVEVLFKR